jgi:hypothetical protein
MWLAGICLVHGFGSNENDVATKLSCLVNVFSVVVWRVGRPSTRYKGKHRLGVKSYVTTLIALLSFS